MWPPDGSDQDIVISTEPREIVVLALVRYAHMKGLLNADSTRYDRQTDKQTQHDSGENNRTILSYENFLLLLLLFL